MVVLDEPTYATQGFLQYSLFCKIQMLSFFRAPLFAGSTYFVVFHVALKLILVLGKAALASRVGFNQFLEYTLTLEHEKASAPDSRFRDIGSIDVRSSLSTLNLHDTLQCGRYDSPR